MSKHIYIGKEPECGCIKAACVDDGIMGLESRARSVASMIRCGLKVERVEAEAIHLPWGCDKCKRPEYKEPPGLKLWKCRVECVVIIAASEEPESWDVAKALRDEADDNPGGFTEHSDVEWIASIAEVPEKWRDSIPRGDEADDKTCEQLLAEMEAARLEKAAVSPMPNQMELPL